MKKNVLLFFFLVSSLVTSTTYGGHITDGGSLVHSLFIWTGDEVLEFLEENEGGREFTKKWKISLSEFKRDWDKLKLTSVVPVEGPLRDSLTGGLVDAKVKDGKIYLLKKAWKEHFEKSESVHHLVFKEMLRLLGYNSAAHKMASNELIGLMRDSVWGSVEGEARGKKVVDEFYRSLESFFKVLGESRANFYIQRRTGREELDLERELSLLKRRRGVLFTYKEFHFEKYGFKVVDSTIFLSVPYYAFRTVRDKKRNFFSYYDAFLIYLGLSRNEVHDVYDFINSMKGKDALNVVSLKLAKELSYCVNGEGFQASWIFDMSFKKAGKKLRRIWAGYASPPFYIYSYNTFTGLKNQELDVWKNHVSIQDRAWRQRLRDRKPVYHLLFELMLEHAFKKKLKFTEEQATEFNQFFIENCSSETYLTE